MNNIEKLAIEHGAILKKDENIKSSLEWFFTQNNIFEFKRPQLEAFAKALQSSEPVAWRWGNDNAWLLTDEKPVSCDASVMVQPLFTHPPASVPLEKTITAIEQAVMHGWLNRQELRAKIRQAIAEAEGKEG